MQPNFTQKKLEFVCTRIIAIALILSASTQISFAQQQTTKFPQQRPGFENTLNLFEKQKAQQAKAGIKDNDAGVLTKAATEINNPAATCTTFTYSIVAGDPGSAVRSFRDGIVKTCAAPGTCGAPFAGSFHYQIFQWVSCATQCVTVTFNATNANFSFPSVYSAAPNFSNLCTNWVSDPGSSATAGTPIVFSFNAIAATTYYFLVTDVGTLPANGTLQIDAATCSCTPCSGTPAPGNTVATPNPVGSGAPLTLSVSNNPAVANLVHTFQRSLTGSAPWTTIQTGAANTCVTSQTVVTYYRDSVYCTSSSLFGISNPIQVGLLACGWSASTAYPIPILDQANVTIGPTLYSFAGVSNGVVIANSYKFDGTVWTPIAATPQGLEYPAAVTDGANIYILGGASTTGVSLNTLYRYNVAANTYTTLAPFTTGVWNTSAAYLNGKIYKFCGTAAASTAVMEIYDIASNTWTTGAPYPQALSFVTCIARNGFIYAAGGVSTATLTATNKAYRYDPASNTWDDPAIADMSFQHWGAAGDFYNNGFVVSGGYINGAVTIGPNTEQWNQGPNTWSGLPDQMTAAGRMGGAAMGGSFYVIGGRTAASAGFVGTVLNQKLFCVPPTPCSGTPDPGNTLASANPVCSGVTFTLSLTNNPFVSGLTYQWQSAPAAAGPWTNIPGATNITHSLSQTGATWYRAIVTCTPSGLSGTSNPVLVADGQGVFTSQPVSTSAQCGSCVTFSFTATGNSLTYSWEYRTTPGGFWLNVTGAPIAGATVTGQTTNSLTLCNISAALNGYQFRGLIQGPCTAVDFSNVVTLTVTPYIVNVSPSSATICAGQVQQLCITNTVSGPTTASFTSGPLNFNVPDNIGTASTFTIPVAGIPAGALITDIRIHLNMTHTYPADMVFNLKGTHATNIVSLYKHNTNTDNGAVSIPTAGFFNAVCSQVGTTQWKAVPTPFRYGITPPTGPFAADALNGVTNPGYTIMDPIGWVSNAPSIPSIIGAAGPNGTWTLAMCDGGPLDFGNFTGWTIDIDYTAPVFAQGIWTSSPAAPNTMFNDAAATIPYVPGTPQSCIFVKPTVNTNYTVVVTTATPCVSAPTTVPVTVITPLSGLVQPANRTVCVGSNATFTVGTTGGPFTYSWEVSINNGLTWSTISGATSATLTLTAVTQLMNNNLYRVTVNGGPCGSTTSAAARLNVNQLPIVTISSTTLQLVPGRVATITGTSSPAPFSATSWSWTLNGNIIAGANTNTVTATIDQQGDYQATVTDINGCVGKSNTITIGSQLSDNLWIIPNPNNGQFQVRWYYNGAIAERRKVQIYNSMGQLMAQKEFDLTSATPPFMSMNFNLPLLAAGTYVVKVVDKNSQTIKSGLMVIQ